MVSVRGTGRVSQLATPSVRAETTQSSSSGAEPSAWIQDAVPFETWSGLLLGNVN